MVDKFGLTLIIFRLCCIDGFCLIDPKEVSALNTSVEIFDFSIIQKARFNSFSNVLGNHHVLYNVVLCENTHTMNFRRSNSNSPFLIFE
jgi:hypothetical protein